MIKFKYEGIEFEVSTPREAAQVVRELRRQPPSLPGLFDTITHAMEARPVTPPKAAGGGEVIDMVNAARALLAQHHGSFDRLDMTHEFLTAVRNARAHSSRGLNADQVVRVLKIKHPKGIGGRSAIINDVLRELRFQPDQVYNNDRTPQGRLWTAQERIDEAIAMIERANRKELVPQR